MRQLRSIHRLVTFVVAFFVVYLGATGTLIQLTDLRSILLSYPATNPNVMAMREAFDGPSFYAVRQAADYDAAALPTDFDYRSALRNTLAAARAAVGSQPLGYVEFRMEDGAPVGQVGVGRGHLRILPATGAIMQRTAIDPHDDESPASTRNSLKHLHRMTTFGNWALVINVVVAAGLAVLIGTGTWMYAAMYAARRHGGSLAVVWSGGGVWRSMHRAISILAAAWLAIVVASGAWLAYESLYLGIAIARHVGPLGPPPMPPTAFAISPAQDAALPAMLDATLAAAQAHAAGAPLKVVRLRHYADYRQGILITGGPAPRQLVYDTRTGAAMTTDEPGYPQLPMPFGWEAHQIAKRIHRGDYFGLTGRWMDLFAGCAMVYLAVSGIVMYWSLWRRRREQGRRALLWN